MAEYRAVCRVDDVPDGRAVGVDVDGLGIAVFNDGGSFVALLNRCPHANGSMSQGWIEDGEAVCPLHMWRFKLKSGRCSTIQGQSLHKFACEIRDGMIWVEA